jgi:hypothetical protein
LTAQVFCFSIDLVECVNVRTEALLLLGHLSNRYRMVLRHVIMSIAVVDFQRDVTWFRQTMLKFTVKDQRCYISHAMTIMELNYVVAHYRGLQAVYMKLIPHAVALHATSLMACN